MLNRIRILEMFLSKVEADFLFQVYLVKCPRAILWGVNGFLWEVLPKNEVLLSKQQIMTLAWDKLDYLAESESHLKDIFTFKEIKFGDEHLAKLVDVSNQMFKTCVRYFSFLTKW